MSSKQHIVDELIAERAPFLSSKPLIWKAVRSVLNPLLKYKQAVELANTVQQQSGRSTFKMCSKELNLQVTVSGINKIPKTGPCILICNHPTGLADGIAIHDAISKVRNDFMIYANADAFRVTANFSDILIPVELDPTAKDHTKTKETLNQTKQALDAGKALVIFPSGRLSYLTLQGLKERPWKTSFVRIAQKYQIPIVPMHMKSRNSWLFYLFAFLSNELRDISLFYELLNKSGRQVEVNVGTALPINILHGSDIDTTTLDLQAYVESAKFGNQFQIKN